MMLCPYKDMTQLHSLPCTREDRGFWIYCSFCGQKMQPETPFHPVANLITFLVVAIMLLLVVNSLSNSLNPPQNINTLERINPGPFD
ncbi:hypothetical protein [Oscillatoria sp. HE19RPO]|uniref:hypothetical protein n=1 Tax=Oscillatoria sp. HE19RPO TaxID=2954806 RepID=UPI0020C2E31C|nr:hypothetical protein [Oscillatoria sp. HE19RPO]